MMLRLKDLHRARRRGYEELEDGDGSTLEPAVTAEGMGDAGVLSKKV